MSHLYTDHEGRFLDCLWAQLLLHVYNDASEQQEQLPLLWIVPHEQPAVSQFPPPEAFEEGVNVTVSKQCVPFRAFTNCPSRGYRASCQGAGLAYAFIIGEEAQS